MQNLKIFITVVFLIGNAHAYTVTSIQTDGCHEKLSSYSLRTVRKTLDTAKPLPTNSNEDALADDVEFNPDEDMKDIGAISFLLGVRDNDLKGSSSNDLSQLALVHGDPKSQDEHCLRNENHDEPDGSQAAITSCRTFILNKISQALDGLDSAGYPDVNKRMKLAIHLSLRGDIDASLPTFYVRMGQAVHAIQDSFTHTFRTSDGMKITTVLNWVDAANGQLDEARDGHSHEKDLDICDDPDDLRTQRRKLAEEATIAILQATLDPTKDPEQKINATQSVLDTYLSYSPGCTYDNQWCDAAELAYEDHPSILGCRANGANMFLMLTVFMCLFFLRRKKRNKNFIALVAFSFISLSQSHAYAFDENETIITAEAPPPQTAVEPGPVNPSKAAWGTALGFAGSLNNPAVAGSFGIRRRLSRHWTVGWDVEMNPWISPSGEQTVRLGVINTFGTVIIRVPLAHENFNLRTTFNFGSSTLLIDLYGAPKGSTGFYGAIYPLGVEWKASKSYYFILNPIGYALPIPQLEGVPLTYSQYRVSIAFEWMWKN